MTYTLTNSQSVIRNEDGACIPFDKRNADYIAYLSWIAKGNKPRPYKPPRQQTPQSVPLWAARTALEKAGLLDAANDAVISSDNLAIKNFWEYGNFIDRKSAAINLLATKLGLTSAQVDDLFVAASNLIVE